MSFITDNIYRRFGKRVFDFTLAVIGLSAVGFPMLIIGLAVKTSSGTPVFFRQKRVGRNGKLFELVKFRTMKSGSESTSSVTTRNDDRITAIGKKLRKFKLDELPQLYNVLKGDMSFVGPRPDVPGYADSLKGDQRRILEFRPGITGPATLAYRDEEELLANLENPKRYNDEIIYPHKVELNLEYIDNCNLLGDLKYILKTILPKK